MRIQELKQYLKEEALHIRNLKSQRKKAKHGYIPGLQERRYEYRIRHVAYSLSRGRSYEQIEPRTNERNYQYNSKEYFMKQVQGFLSTIEQEAPNESIAA